MRGRHGGGKSGVSAAPAREQARPVPRRPYASVERVWRGVARAQHATLAGGYGERRAHIPLAAHAGASPRTELCRRPTPAPAASQPAARRACRPLQRTCLLKVTMGAVLPPCPRPEQVTGGVGPRTRTTRTTDATTRGGSATARAAATRCCTPLAGGGCVAPARSGECAQERVRARASGLCARRIQNQFCAALRFANQSRGAAAPPPPHHL
jgi:hypothetical protein